MAFMNLDAVTLARLQFGITIAFHYLYPPLTIGLATLMVFMEGAYLKTGNVVYKNMTHFWSSIFAVTFAMGVATGIVMEFQFGTNWAAYSRYVGDVFGSALAAEGIFAFFLESGFLAVMVFGWDRVSARVHYLATILVWVGSLFSAVWIVVADSWMQTPAGFHIVNGRAEVTSFWQVVLNPSTLPRLTHTLTGAMVLGAFFVMSVTAYYIIKQRHLEMARPCFKLALIFGAVTSLGQLGLGHVHAIQIARTQPAKLAAYEAIFKTGTSGTGMYMFGIPDTDRQQVNFGIHIPDMLSLLVYLNPNKPVPGLDQVPRQDQPPVAIPFLTFHVMVALGMAFIGLTFLGLFLLWRGKLFEQKWLMWIFVLAVPGPYLANHAGWTAAEVGRQPWIVYNLMRTSDAISRNVDKWQISTSLGLFTGIYLMLFAVWIYVLNSKIQLGPGETKISASFPLKGIADAASRTEGEGLAKPPEDETDMDSQGDKG